VQHHKAGQWILHKMRSELSQIRKVARELWVGALGNVTISTVVMLLHSERETSHVFYIEMKGSTLLGQMRAPNASSINQHKSTTNYSVDTSHSIEERRSFKRRYTKILQKLRLKVSTSSHSVY